MKKIAILSLCCWAAQAQSITLFPDRIETSATGTIKVRINNTDQLVISADSVNINSVTGSGNRYITTTPNGRLTTVTTAGTGVNGLNIYQGAITPSNAFGVSGETYINNSTWDVYQKVSTKWTLRGNIKGEALNVIQGDTIPSPLIGLDGETYINSSTWDVSKKVNGTWVIQGNIQGAGNNIPSNASVNVPSLLFTSSTLNNTPQYDFRRGTVYFLSGVQDGLKVGINLPDKAVITGITAAIIDNNASNNLRVTVYRSANNSAISEEIATAKTAGDSGSNTYVTMLNVPVSLTVDNENYQYYLIVDSLDAINQPASWQGVGLEVKNVIINYQY